MLKSIISFSLLYWIYYFLWISSQISSNSSTNNWTRLLIFDDKINFYFLHMFLYTTSVVYWRTFLHFMSSVFNDFKKLILKTYPLPKYRVLNVEFADIAFKVTVITMTLLYISIVSYLILRIHSPFKCKQCFLNLSCLEFHLMQKMKWKRVLLGLDTLQI